MMIKILVVDDEPGICDVIEKTFSYIGFFVFSATTAKKALSIIKKENPKIIFLDILLSDQNGLELLKQIKQEDPSRIVIMVTAITDEATKKKARELGADEFISKPFSHNYLRDIVVDKIKHVLVKSGSMKKPTILIVDDEKQTRETIVDFISNRFECQLDQAQDGQSAILKVKDLRPDVIFLDIKMPGISGIEAIGEIKKLSPQSRMIVISAWNSTEVVNSAIKAGATDYMAKPISLSVLGERLKTILIGKGKLILKKN